MNWGAFACTLLAPSVMSTMLVACFRGADVFDLFLLLSLGGSVVSGGACAYQLARRFRGGQEPGLGLTLALACLFIPTSVALCFGGCVLMIP